MQLWFNGCYFSCLQHMVGEILLYTHYVAYKLAGTFVTAPWSAAAVRWDANRRVALVWPRHTHQLHASSVSRESWAQSSPPQSPHSHSAPPALAWMRKQSHDGRTDARSLLIKTDVLEPTTAWKEDCHAAPSALSTALMMALNALSTVRSTPHKDRNNNSVSSMQPHLIENRQVSRVSK